MIVLVKFRRDLEMYINVTRYLFQTYSRKLLNYLSSQLFITVSGYDIY